MSILGGGPGNFDLEKSADQVPAKPPAGMPVALAVNEAASSVKAKSGSLRVISWYHNTKRFHVNTCMMRNSAKLAVVLPTLLAAVTLWQGVSDHRVPRGLVVEAAPSIDDDYI